MGQDIHMAIERWQNGQWTLQPDIPVWDNRNYLMYSVLTGRHRGEIPNIANSRGIPTDIDKHTFVEDSYGNTNGTIEFLAADHSYSWLLLSEIKSFNWNSSWGKEAIIPLRKVDNKKSTEVESYDAWKLSEPHEPKGYYSESSSSFRDSNMPNLYQADRYLEDWKDEVIRKDGWDLSLSFYVCVRWTIYMKDVSKDFLYWINTFVSQIDEANAVRIVFGFDS